MNCADTTFVLLDCETTGTDPATAELLEVAAIHCDWFGGSFARFSSLVRPQRPVPPSSSAVHGLSSRDFTLAPDRARVMHALDAFVPRSAVVVAYNSDFDAGMLPELGAREWLDAERLAHHLLIDAENHKLGTIRWTLGDGPIDTEGLPAHRALADVFTLRFVFVHLLDRFRDAVGRHPSEIDVVELLDFARAPYELRSLPFGKHRGEPLADVPDDYLRWVVAKMPDLRPDTRYTVDRELARRRVAA